MDILEWIDYARDVHSTQLDTKIKVVGIIGKDSPDHGKGDNINSYLRENAFPVASSEEETCSIRAHFSEDEQILFLVMNGVDDLANIKKSLKSEEGKKKPNYFETMAKSEQQQIRMLHLLFISCHFIIIFEPTSRIDLEFMRFLRRVNSSRMQLRRKVSRVLGSAGFNDVSYNNRIMNSAESEGRMVIPRLLLAFQRNNIRPEVNVGKKRELYEKLEKSLDGQLNDILKSYDLIENGSSALCQLNETIPCVHLLNPKTVKRDIITEMFESLMFDAENRVGSVPGLSSNNSLVMFLEDNFRSEKNEITLKHVIELFDVLMCVLDGSLEEEKKLNEFNVMNTFINRLRENHMEEALRIYTDEQGPSKPKNIERRGAYRSEQEAEPMRIRSKAEHIVKFKEAVRYIESVVATDTDEVIADLARRCDELWQSDMRACEAISMMGNPCVRKVHPTFGDLTVPESRWVAHDSSNTLISTCICGRKQLIRQEPFSVKEANYDFYEKPEFQCCRRLWKHQFQVYLEDSDEKEEILWAARESNSLHATKKTVRREDELAEDEDLVVPMTESPFEDEGSEDDTDIPTQSSLPSSDDDMYVRPSSRREELSKTELDVAKEYAKRQQQLEKSGKTQEFIMDVPNSLTAGKLPLFPSWHLTSLGDSSVYNHGSGLKSQPNFKIGGDYLLPVVVFLDVDKDTWNRDLNKIRSEDFTRKYINSAKEKDEIPRVKLFCGFEYECSRGHRFFVDYNGEPLIYPKGSNIPRESAQRSSLGDLLKADLPIRRPCTCRKLPLKSAQLQKIHVVTPKAPVHITLDPKVLIPGHQGVYGTGQAPLELHHSKYYILTLPTIYSGPSGTWMPEEYTAEKEGIWKGGALTVTYKPVLSFRW